MTFENDLIYPGTQEYVSEIIINNIKEIHEVFVELISQSTLRHLDTVCVTHNLKYKENINLLYDINKWVKTSTDHIKKT